MNKTNAIRILESKDISFKVKEYVVNENELDAISVANKINANPEAVFKTLVVRGDKNGINVFVIPGNYELDLKKAAKASGNKKIELIKVKELLPLTGYVRGGCSPVGMKKLFPTFIEESAQLFDSIFVSAGVRGMQIQVNSDDLIDVTSAEYHNII